MGRYSFFFHNDIFIITSIQIKLLSYRKYSIKEKEKLGAYGKKSKKIPFASIGHLCSLEIREAVMKRQDMFLWVLEIHGYGTMSLKEGMESFL